LNQPILNNPQDYNMTVIRVNLPGNDIPIFKFQCQTGSNITGIYSVTLSYLDQPFQAYVPYFPQFIGYNLSNPDYFSVYQYQPFINLINSAFYTAWLDLTTAVPDLGSIAPPFLKLDPITQLVSINIDPEFSMSPSLSIYMNWPLFSFFQSFDYAFYGYGQSFGQDCKLSDYNIGGGWKLLNLPGTSYTGGNYYTGLSISQEFPSLYNWNQFQTVVLQSNNIRVKQEYIPSGGSNNTIPIITDFIPQSFNNSNLRQNLTYIPVSEYRLLDLISTDPMKQLDGALYYQSTDGSLTPVYLAPGSLCSGKFLFRNKRLADKSKKFGT